jgi:hypothetical protein
MVENMRKNALGLHPTENLKYVMFRAKARSLQFRHKVQYAVLPTKRASKEARKRIKDAYPYRRFDTKGEAKHDVRTWTTEKGNKLKAKEYYLKRI